MSFLVLIFQIWIVVATSKRITIGIPKECSWNENRVALCPSSIKKLSERGYEVLIERNAGVRAQHTDKDYQFFGGKVVGLNEVWRADVLVKVQPPKMNEAERLKNKVLLSFIQSPVNSNLIQKLQKTFTTVLGLEDFKQFPLTTIKVTQEILKKQEETTNKVKMFDSESSQAVVAGEQALYEALHESNLFKSSPTHPGIQHKLFIIGLGAAGLSAAQTGRKLGFEVNCYDVHIDEDSTTFLQDIGAHSITIQYCDQGTMKKGFPSNHDILPIFKVAELATIRQYIMEADIVITTAVPTASRIKTTPHSPTLPLLITEDLLSGMKPNATVVDMAASLHGGNVARSRPNQVITTPHGVKIIGYTDLPSRMPGKSSLLFSKNMEGILCALHPWLAMQVGSANYSGLPPEPLASMVLLNRGQLMNHSRSCLHVNTYEVDLDTIGIDYPKMESQQVCEDKPTSSHVTRVGIPVLFQKVLIKSVENARDLMQWMVTTWARIGQLVYQSIAASNHDLMVYLRGLVSTSYAAAGLWMMSTTSSLVEYVKRCYQELRQQSIIGTKLLVENSVRIRNFIASLFVNCTRIHSTVPSPVPYMLPAKTERQSKR